MVSNATISKVKKYGVVAIIFLLICVSLAPSIHANIQQETLDSELVEFTTEICGLPGKEPQTVQLTPEQAEEVDRLFDEIKIKLDNTASREETVEIYNDAIVELDKLGLLGGLSVEQAQMLIIEPYQHPLIQKNIDKQMRRFPHILNDSQNILCLISGKTNMTWYWGPNHIIYLAGLLFAYIGYGLLLYLKPILGLLLIALGWVAFLFFLFLEEYSPLLVLNRIYLGDNGIPATGWIHTIGLFGIKSWNGSFFGQIPKSYYLGIIGFSGLRIRENSSIENHVFNMGSALYVKIGRELP